MNGERREEKALHQGWWYVDLFGLLPPSLHVCILFMGQSFALLTQLDGVPCGANLTIVMKRGACNTASVNLLKATLRLLKKTSARKDYQRSKTYVEFATINIQNKKETGRCPGGNTTGVPR
jgi:hypothetical protein